MAGTEVQTQINAAVTKAKDGAAQIKSAKESLDSYATFIRASSLIRQERIRQQPAVHSCHRDTQRISPLM